MKLTARGRTVLAQVSIVRDTPVGAASVSLSGNVYESRKNRTEYALLSDGVIGVKHTFLHPNGKVDHSAGWKVKSHLKAPLRATLMRNGDLTVVGRETVDKWVKRYTDGGFTRV